MINDHSYSCISDTLFFCIHIIIYYTLLLISFFNDTICTSKKKIKKKNETIARSKFDCKQTFVCNSNFFCEIRFNTEQFIVYLKKKFRLTSMNNVSTKSRCIFFNNFQITKKETKK